MTSKTVFARKEEDIVNGSLIASHSTRFLDNAFYEKFEDPEISVQPVEIKSIDAGWILK
jgi:hypothetical protein